jgi:hypothetical protein
MMKTAICFVIGVTSLGFAQSTMTISPQLITANGAKGAALPRYVVYHHFLAWTSALDREAKNRGLANPYAFAQPFAKSIGFSNPELDLLKFES